MDRKAPVFATLGCRLNAYETEAMKDLAGGLGDAVIVNTCAVTAEAVRKALAGCGAVIYTAAKAGVWGPRSEYFQTNLEGPRLLLQLMEEAAITRLVHCSTPSVVFNGGAFNGEDESLPYGSI